MGEVQIRENDIYGLNVNLTSRIQSEIKLEGILVSDRVKEDYNTTIGSTVGIKFSEPEEYTLKSFGKKTLYRATSMDLAKAWQAQRLARMKLFHSTASMVPRAPRMLRH